MPLRVEYLDALGLVVDSVELGHVDVTVPCTKSMGQELYSSLCQLNASRRVGCIQDLLGPPVPLDKDLCRATGM